MGWCDLNMVLEVSLWTLRGKIKSRETAYEPIAIIRERNGSDWAASRERRDVVGVWIPFESRDTRICQEVGYGVWRKGCKGRLESFRPGLGGSGIEVPFIRREGFMMSRLGWGKIRDSKGGAISSATMADIANGSSRSFALISATDSEFFSTQCSQ